MREHEGSVDWEESLWPQEPNEGEAQLFCIVNTHFP